MCSSETNTLFL
jgi:hypothetical protein